MEKALIFDFDGVLVSSEGPRFKAIQTIAARHDIIIADSAIKIALGKTTPNFLKEVLADNEQPMIETIMKDFRNEYLANVTDYVQPIDFTVEFIRDYQDTFPIAIASMSTTTTIKRFLTHFGISEKITSIVSQDEVTHHKPNPEIYLKTAAELQVEPMNCLVFEDTVVGVKAALDAGMRCCVIVNGMNIQEEFKELDIFAFVDSQESMLQAVEKFKATFSHLS